jgi:hypothetical protein
MQPKFETVVDLKIAEALGLSVPRFVIASADELIEWLLMGLNCRAAFAAVCPELSK